MPTVDTRASGLDRLANTGNPVQWVLTWPTGFASGKTFTATVGGTAITPGVAGDVVTISVTGAQTTTLGNGRHAVKVYVDGVLRIFGRLLLGETSTDQPTSAAVTVTTTDSVSVAVTVASGGLDLATVQDLIDDLVAGAPGALDTLNELAAALGDDANFATTVTSALAAKASTADLTTAIASEVTRADGAYVAFIGTPAVPLTDANTARPVTSGPVVWNMATGIVPVNALTGDIVVTQGSVLLIADISGLQAALDLKAPLASPTFTGTVAGVTKSMVGLGNVDNTSDANKPVSTAAQTALDAKEPRYKTIEDQTGASYTFALGDDLKFFRFDRATAQTVTVPPNSSVAFPVGTVLNGKQHGAGLVTIAAGAGVTVNSFPGLKCRGQHAAFSIIKTATDTWTAFGALSS